MLAHVERDARMSAAPRHLKKPLLAYLAGGDLLTCLIAPAIYSLIVPLVLLDLWVTAYQRICFTALAIPRVDRRGYVALDRHRLPYLNVLEKLNCTFCSYANGVFAYVREVSARTEQYWCPIKHAQAIRHPHGRYRRFVPYGDAQAYRQQLPGLRAAIGRRGRGRSPR